MTELFAWLFDVPPRAWEGVTSWTVRFTGFHDNLWLLMGMFLVFATLGWLVVRTYRREGESHHRLKMTLAAVRIAVLIVLLLIMLQPALVLQSEQQQQGAVAVLVDDSLSMRWADQYDDRQRLDALAQLLGRDAEALRGDERPTRLQLVRDVVGNTADTWQALAANHPLLWYRFGGASDDNRRLQPLAGDGEPDAALAALSAEGYSTDVGRAVRDVLADLQGRRLSAIVLVTDGRSTAAGDVDRRLAAAQTLANRRGVPLFAVAVGDPTPPRNLAVELRGPAEGRKGSTLQFTAVLSHRGFAEKSVSLQLLRAPVGTEDWQVAVDTQTATLPPADSGDAITTVDQPVPVAAPDVGVYTYKVAVEPLAGEQIVADNEATATVRVIDEKVKVLLVSGDAGWEFQYLRNLLLANEEQYKVSVWQQNADTRFNQDASTGMKREGLPIAKDDLFQYDVIILYDPKAAPDSLDQAFLDMLESFVSQHHGGLCYIVGNKHTAEHLQPGGPLAPIAELLPVVIASEDSSFAKPLRPSRTAHQVELSDEGRDHPMMQLTTGDDAAAVWQSLPGLYSSYPVRRLKMLATALVVSGDRNRLTTDNQREPVIALQYYGKGRVLYMGIDSTWRWRLVDAAARYNQFWFNAVDFLAAGRLDKKRIVVTTAGRRFDAGSDVVVRVEAYDRDFVPMVGETFTVEMIEAGTDNAAIHELQKIRPGHFEARIVADRVGTFELRPHANASGQSDWLDEDVATRRIEVRLPQRELRRPEADHDALRRLAGADHRFLYLHDVAALPDRVPVDTATVVTQSTHMLWNTLFALVVLGVLLLTEWTTRKMFNMM